MTIQPLNIDQSDGEAKELLTAVQSKLGRVPNFFGVLAKAPSVLNAYLSTSENLKGGVLDAKVGEQIAIALAEKNACGYCLAAHTAIGKMVGLNDTDLQVAQTGQAFDPKAQAAVRLALAVNESHGEGIDKDVAAAREAGLSETEVLEVIGHVAMNILSNAVNGIAKTDIDFPKVDLKSQAA